MQREGLLSDQQPTYLPIVRAYKSHWDSVKKNWEVEPPSEELQEVCAKIKTVSNHQLNSPLWAQDPETEAKDGRCDSGGCTVHLPVSKIYGEQISFRYKVQPTFLARL